MTNTDTARTVVALLTAGVNEHNADCVDIYSTLDELERLRAVAMLVGICHAHMDVLAELTGHSVADQIAVLGLGATEVET